VSKTRVRATGVSQLVSSGHGFSARSRTRSMRRSKGIVDVTASKSTERFFETRDEYLYRGPDREQPRDPGGGCGALRRAQSSGRYRAQTLAHAGQRRMQPDRERSTADRVQAGQGPIWLGGGSMKPTSRSLDVGVPVSDDRPLRAGHRRAGVPEAGPGGHAAKAGLRPVSPSITCKRVNVQALAHTAQGEAAACESNPRKGRRTLQQHRPGVQPRVVRLPQ
jgi:hypothetical protein